MKANVFAQHPAGFRIHVELDDSRISPEMGSPEVIQTLLKNLGILTHWFAEAGYTGEYAAQAQTNGSAPTSGATEASSSNPACEQCGGATEFKQGKAKNGKAWAGYFCLKTKGAPKDQQHPVHWLDD